MFWFCNRMWPLPNYAANRWRQRNLIPLIFFVFFFIPSFEFRHAKNRIKMISWAIALISHVQCGVHAARCTLTHRSIVTAFSHLHEIKTNDKLIGKYISISFVELSASLSLARSARSIEMSYLLANAIDYVIESLCNHRANISMCIVARFVVVAVSFGLRQHLMPVAPVPRQTEGTANKRTLTLICLIPT